MREALDMTSRLEEIKARFAAAELLEKWMNEPGDYDEKVWPLLHERLKEEYLHHRKDFAYLLARGEELEKFRDELIQRIKDIESEPFIKLTAEEYRNLCFESEVINTTLEKK